MAKDWATLNVAKVLITSATLVLPFPVLASRADAAVALPLAVRTSRAGSARTPSLSMRATSGTTAASASRLHLVVRAWGASGTMVLQLAMWTAGADAAVALPLAVRTRPASGAIVLSLPMWTSLGEPLYNGLWHIHRQIVDHRRMQLFAAHLSHSAPLRWHRAKELARKWLFARMPFSTASAYLKLGQTNILRGWTC